jgi:histone H3/H4
LGNKRAFSLYDVEQFLREAGAERINEKAVISLEKELQDTVNEIVNEASIYANYAGRKKLINVSDIELANKGRRISKNYIARKGKRIRRSNNISGKSRIEAPKIMLINDIPVIKTEANII